MDYILKYASYHGLKQNVCKPTYKLYTWQIHFIDILMAKLYDLLLCQ